MVQVSPDYQLWVEDHGDPQATPLLLIMGANASGVAWPQPLVQRLAEQHWVIRYDHRDTGRSSWAFDTHPYAVHDLATDAVTVLDTLRIDRAHVVGMSLGGILVQLLMLDQSHRLRSATVFATCTLETGLADPSGEGGIDLPGPDPRLLALWQEMTQDRDRDDEIAWRVEHWRILNGDVLAFDAEEFRALEERIIIHSGTHRNVAAHARADPARLDRAAELAKVTVPTLVIEAPEDPINPPPHAAHLAKMIGASQRIVIPGMGHALGAPVLEPLTQAILTHTRCVERASTAAGNPAPVFRSGHHGLAT